MTKAGDKREAGDNLRASRNMRANECISNQSGNKKTIRSDRFQRFQQHSRQPDNSRIKTGFCRAENLRHVRSGS